MIVLTFTTAILFDATTLLFVSADTKVGRERVDMSDKLSKVDFKMFIQNNTPNNLYNLKPVLMSNEKNDSSSPG